MIPIFSLMTDSHSHLLIQDIKIHPDYSLGLFPLYGANLHINEASQFDYAILTLKDKLTFSKTIVPACLPTKQANNQFSSYAGEEAWTSGWGAVTPLGTHSTVPKDKTPDRMKELKTKVWTNQDCATEWAKKDATRSSKLTE